MISINVTSDSKPYELKLVAELLNRLATKTEANVLTVKLDASEVRNAIDQAVEELRAEPTFNVTELVEAEQLGKSAPSTVAADPSTIAPVDMQDNTLTPDPTTVFGQAVQTTANVANPVVPTTDNPALDANGLPWDHRIHSTNHELSKNGTWRKRRGVDVDTIAAVEAELKGIMSLPTPFTFTPLAPQVSHGSPIPQVIAEIDNKPVHSMTFAELLDGVTQAMVGGEVTQVAIGTALQSLGLSALPQLVARPDLIPAFREALGGVV